MVAVVGRLFQKWFPAQPNLSYTFIWDKTDAYGQFVYGLSEAVGEFASKKEHQTKSCDLYLIHEFYRQEYWVSFTSTE